MTTRGSKCFNHEIIALLESQSDSDTQERVKNPVKRLQTRKTSKSQNTKVNVPRETVISSDEENIFRNVKYELPKKSYFKNEKALLRIKLRRSTEQSLYKIDTDSECEKRSHLRPSSTSGIPLKPLQQRKKNCSDVESESVSIESVLITTEGSSDEDKIKMSNKKELIQMDSAKKVLPRSRTRRPPLRYSSYHCETLSPVNDSPYLRSRKTIDYNEDSLLINSLVSNVKLIKKADKLKENKDSNVSPVKDDSEPNTPKSSVRNTKRNRNPSLKDNENDSGTDSKVIKAKSKKVSNKTEDSTNNELNELPEKAIDKQNLSTPVKMNKQKRAISINRQKFISHDMETETDDGHLADICKHIKISSPTGNTTPVKRDKQMTRTSASVQKNAQIVTNNNSNDEENCLADMYKRIKISSAKKGTPRRRNNTPKVERLQSEGTPSRRSKLHSVKRNLTPSIGKRQSAVLKSATPLQEARAKLHVSAVPKSLPCREEEFNSIFTFLRSKLEDRNGGCIYISGVPGTGKTATVNEAVRCLQKLIIKGQLDEFNYVAINGMKLTEPRQSYVQILKQLDGRTATWEQAYRILDKKFHSNNSKMTLLLVDELDFLCTKRQDVVYNLLDWPTKATAQLVVVTIANTMDLPERILMGRVTSRLGFTRLTFQPYNYKQLQEIVMSRLKDYDGFRSEAIQLVARKVSAVSGDARRALDICRRAMEIAELRNAETISLQDVSEAVSEMIASAKVQAIKHCSKMEQIFLQSVAAEVTRTSIEEVYFKDAYKQLEALCSFDGIKVPTITEILAVCGRLGASRLLICEHSRSDIYQKILLNVSTDDIHYATQNIDLNSK